MNIESLKLFCDVVRCRSFSRGAAINSISQSAASQSVSLVERDLGVQLIDRRKRPFLLTPEGEVCYKGFCEILHQFESIKVSIESSRNRVEGVVRISAIYSVGLHDMNRAMQEFMGKYSDANVRLEYHLPDRIHEAVRNNEVDLGIVSYPIESRDLSVIPLRDEKIVLVSHPDHHLASRSAVEPRKLSGEDFVTFDRDLAISRELDRFFREHNVSIRKVMEFDNIETIKQAVEIGAGLSLLPQPTVRREVMRGSLVVIPLHDCNLRRPIGIIHMYRKVFTQAMNKFIEILCAHSPGDDEDAASI